MASDKMQNINTPHASIFRRGAAMVYDGLLLFAVTMLAGFLIVPFTGTIELIEQGEQSSSQNIFNPFMSIYYLTVYYLFFSWFWTHGGQTLGMRAWHTRLETNYGEILNWKQALVRYLISLPMWFFWIMVIGKNTGVFNIPFANLFPGWMLYIIAVAWTVFDHIPNNWRDRTSKTIIIDTPK